MRFQMDSGDMLDFEVDVSPLLLRVNSKLKNSFAVPADVAKAMWEVEAAVYDEAQLRRWETPRYVGIILIFTFPTMVGDLDGPLKRTIDAMAKGLKHHDAARGIAKTRNQFHDGRVVYLHAAKRTGEPGIEGSIYACLPVNDSPGGLGGEQPVRPPSKPLPGQSPLPGWPPPE